MKLTRNADFHSTVEASPVVLSYCIFHSQFSLRVVDNDFPNNLLNSIKKILERFGLEKVKDLQP